MRTPLFAGIAFAGIAFAGIALAALTGCAHTETEAAAADRGAEHVRAETGYRAQNQTQKPRPEPPPPYDPACASSFEPGAEPAADLVRLTSACAASAGLVAVTPVKVGAAQGELAEVDRLSFRGRAGRCYRVFAVGDPTVGDLDIAVVDEEGALAAADLSGDRFPVAPPTGFLCLRSDQLFTIQIGVMAGSGSYLAQVWGTN